MHENEAFSGSSRTLDFDGISYRWKQSRKAILERYSQLRRFDNGARSIGEVNDKEVVAMTSDSRDRNEVRTCVVAQVHPGNSNCVDCSLGTGLFITSDAHKSSETG
jgi:hypothetical protein